MGKYHIKRDAARPRLGSIIDRVLAENQKRYIVGSGPDREPILTIAPELRSRDLVEPVIPLTMSAFKTHYARWETLARMGFVFTVKKRGEERFVVIRAHTSYKDPFKGLLDTWKSEFGERFAASFEDAKIAALAHKIEEMRKLLLDSRRMTLRYMTGNNPFNDDRGQPLPPVVSDEDDDEEEVVSA